MPPRDDHRAICFGKLPIAGDFVRGDAEAPELAALDLWIQEGLHGSLGKLGGQWQARFDALPPARFLWSPEKSDTVIAGWWQASRDSAGRRYPFLVAARLAAIAQAEYALLPIALGQFFADSRRLLDGSWHGLGTVGAIAAVRKLECHVDLPRARAEFAAAMSTAPTATVWAGGREAPELLLQDLAQLATAAVAPRFGLRWPTPGEAVDASFWLSALAHFGVGKPRLFMWHSAADRAPGTARVVLGRLEPRMFTGMVFFDHDDDDAYDLGRAHGDDLRLQSAQRRFGAVVTKGTQGQVLAALRQEIR